MAHWQLGHKEEAQPLYDKAVDSMEKYDPDDEELLHFRAEAAELLGINESPAEELGEQGKTDRDATGRIGDHRGTSGRWPQNVEALAEEAEAMINGSDDTRG